MCLPFERKINFLHDLIEKHDSIREIDLPICFSKIIVFDYCIRIEFI